MTTLSGISMIIALAVCIGCHGAGPKVVEKPLSKSEALELAVKLANEKSMAMFSAAPFDSTSYEVLFKEGRWIWGNLDPAGIDGYSARVTFDAYGINRTVEVYLSTDRLAPNTRGSDLERREE